VCQPRKINKASSPMMSLTLQRLQQVAKPGSLIYLISDFYDLNQQTFCPLQQILAHCEIRALKIYDPLEKDAPPPDNYQVSDGKQEIYWDTNDRKGCQQFKNQYSEQHQILKNELSNLQIPLISVATNENWSERLSRAFYHWSDQPCLGI